jgi:hypothetical protein
MDEFDFCFIPWSDEAIFPASGVNSPQMLHEQMLENSHAAPCSSFPQRQSINILATVIT